MAQTDDKPVPDPSQLPAGVRLGLPAEGPGSVAGWGRRFLGVFIDWTLAGLIANTFLDALGRQVGPLLVFVVMHGLLVSTLGMSLGHAITGIAVRRTDVRGVPVGFARGLARTVLLALVIPAVVTDPDRRGLHDRAANTVVVRR